jgi:hypothetical protein
MTPAPEINDTRLGIVRGISYGLFGKPDEFVPQARGLGARVVRGYFFWSQIEPHPGEYTWSAVDALLEQLEGDEEVWLTLCSSSPWATRTATDFLPPSPAKDVRAYAEFVRRTVEHCTGRVRYWQCDNEPSNSALLWSGTAEEYLGQLRAMFTAVKTADPRALVVLGGCGYDVLSSPLDSEQRRFFDTLSGGGRGAFDIFDLHLYGDPYRIPTYVETARSFMRAHGYLKPVVAGEYSGPSLFEFPEVEVELQTALAQAFAAPPTAQSTRSLVAQTSQDTPERKAMKALYARMADLPPKVQMFMYGCPPELEARRHRIACRQLVMRNVLALAEGIQRTLYWNLAPEVPGPVDPYILMALLVGKLPLLDYRGSRLELRHPEAQTFELVSHRLQNVQCVEPVQVGDADVHAFRIERAACEPAYVAWDRRDTFGGEDEPPRDVTLPWAGHAAQAVDAFGDVRPTRVRSGRVHLQVTDTPVFVGDG